MIYIPCTNAEAIAEELAIKGRTVLRSKEPDGKEGAKAALIEAMLDRKTAYIESLFTGGAVVRSMPMIDVHNEFDNALYLVLAGTTRLMFLGKWYWIEEITE